MCVYVLCARVSSSFKLCVCVFAWLALDSEFLTHASMEDPGIHSHVGASDAAVKQSHAMAVVGWRRTAEGSLRLLVQNWWRHKQFFEVDLVYLASRRADLTWIVGTRSVPLAEAPQAAHLPVSRSAIAEVCITGGDTGVRRERWWVSTGPTCVRS